MRFGATIRVTAVFMSALSLAACGNSATGGRPPRTDTGVDDEQKNDPVDSGVVTPYDSGIVGFPDASTDGGSADGGVGDASLPDGSVPSGPGLNGIFAGKFITTNTMSLSNGGSSRVVMLARVSMVDTNGQVALTAQVCSQTFDPIEVQGNETELIYPSLALQNVTVYQATATNQGVDRPFVVAASPVLVGWASNTPATDPLPTTAGDLRVQDQDADGSPGISLGITSGNNLNNARVFVVMRKTMALNGTLMAGDRIQGNNITTTESNILGDDNVPIGLPNTITFTQNPDPAQNQFAIVKLPAGAVNDCASIILQGATLFGF